MFAEAGQLHFLEQAADRLPDARFFGLLQGQPQPDVLAHGLPGEQAIILQDGSAPGIAVDGNDS